MNRLRPFPFNELGKTQHKTMSSVVYKLTCVTYILMCSSRLLVVPSYLSKVRLFQFVAKNVSIILGTKGFR